MEQHPATLWENLADTVPARTALVQGGTRRTWREFDDRASRLAGFLVAGGIGQGAKVGQLLYNSPEFIESYFAALKIRAVPFNINYRYTAGEIGYLLDDAQADALVFHSSLAEVVTKAVSESARDPLLIEVNDDPDHVAGAVRFEEAVANSEPTPRISRSADDVTLIYTGGTTGMPKGVVARVGPALDVLLQTVPPMFGQAPTVVDGVANFTAELEATNDVMVSLPAPPLIHNTGLGIGVAPALAMGGTIVLMESHRFDPAQLWDTVVRERVNAITVVGDPFARPMLSELRNGPDRDLSSMRFISSSGAMFSTEVKAGLVEYMERLMIIDIIAATEGTMGMAISAAGNIGETGRFRPAEGVIVITDDDQPIQPGSGVAGLVALPGGAEGYLHDEVKTASTFRNINGRRFTIPGDFATVESDGTLVLLGRGSSCINTGGEKVFPEEVEEVLKKMEGVEDALVVGLPDERYGQSVGAVISRRAGTDETMEAILQAARENLAGYKVPRTAIFVDQVPRTQVGKADYPEATRMLEEASTPR
jgi:3-oxocholest-4-en-26-oate---CoA ligase